MTNDGTKQRERSRIQIANSRGKRTLIEFSAIAAVSADGDGSDDAMVARTPKALPNRRCGGQYDLGTCAHRLGHRPTERLKESRSAQSTQF